MSDQYVNTSEMKAMIDLMDWLNESFTSGSGVIGLDISISDLNGEPIGEIAFRNNQYNYYPNGAPE